MTETMTPPKQARPQQTTERAPIPIKRLVIAHANPNGVRMPDGPEGNSSKLVHELKAGEHGDVKIEIDHRPWLRVFRIVKMKKVTRTDEKTKKEIHSWVPMGDPFHMPDTWAISIPFED